MMKRILALLLAVVTFMSLTACSNDDTIYPTPSNPTGVVSTPDEAIPTTQPTEPTTAITEPSDAQSTEPSEPEQSTPVTDPSTDTTVQNPNTITVDSLRHTLFNGADAYLIVNNGIPFFTEEEKVKKSFESYSQLDALGRCGVTYACVGKDLMPEDDRESISSVYPSGWKYNGKSNNNQYDFVDGKYLYNRCHLIGFQLTGENANEKNLITGTRYLNINGMLTFENMIADAVREDDLHVLYRVTPIYDGDNLIAEGVLMEGYSVEDNGETIQFCMFAFNVQPGVEINYATGENWLTQDGTDEPTKPDDSNDEIITYILNTKSKKFHYQDCAKAEEISDQNKEIKTCTREELVEDEYSPCGICKP